MSNECKIIEQILPRSGVAPLRVMPPLARQTLSSGATSAAFNKSTQMITVISSIAGALDFQATAGTAPTGSLAPFPINANQEYDFSVRPGSTVRFD